MKRAVSRLKDMTQDNSAFAVQQGAVGNGACKVAPSSDNSSRAFRRRGYAPDVRSDNRRSIIPASARGNRDVISLYRHGKAVYNASDCLGPSAMIDLPVHGDEFTKALISDVAPDRFEERSMMKKMIRSAWFLPMVLVPVLLSLGSTPARAQFGMGYGMMMGGFNYVPSPTDFLNQHALIRAGRGIQGPTNNRVYANNPNSFHNRLRDNGLVTHYDVQRRLPPTVRPQRGGSAGNTARVAPQPAQAAVAAVAKVVVPLVNFFNAARQLIWPVESPVTGRVAGKTRPLRPGLPGSPRPDQAAEFCFALDRHRRASEIA